MNLDWLQVCAEGQTTPCVGALQLAYLVALVVGAVALFVLARRSRDLSTAVLALMPVAIAINIAIGSLVAALKLPIYLDSIGTILVGVLAGPWAGALTGLLSNLIWSILPIPGGAGPVIAFFAPVAAVIGLLAGFWASRGVFQLGPDDARVGGFLSLAAFAATVIGGMAIAINTVGLSLPRADDPDQLGGQVRFIVTSSVIAIVAVAVGLVTRRTVFRLEGRPERARTYLVAASGITAGALAFGAVRLVFGPGGWVSKLDGVTDDGLPDPIPLLGTADLTGLALPDPAGLMLALVIGALVGWLVVRWAGRGDHARLFPVLVAGLITSLVTATVSSPIAAGVFGGVTGGGTDLLVAMFRALGYGVFQAALLQSLASDPVDKVLSFVIVFFILGALPITVRTMFSRGETTVPG
jgi:hypothetical protein